MNHSIKFKKTAHRQVKLAVCLAKKYLENDIKGQLIRGRSFIVANYRAVLVSELSILVE